MDSHTLVYKIHKGIVSVEDYIAWAHTLLQNNVSSNSVNIIASLAPNHNMFEVEDYFKKALKELQIELPMIEPSSRAYIDLLATQILREENEKELFYLAQEIFGVVVDLQYPATPKSRKTLSVSALLNVDITGFSYGIVYFYGLEPADK